MARETIFDVASLTKPFATTLAVMMLVERGDIRLSLQTSEVTNLAAARLSTTSPELFTSANMAGWTAIREAAQVVRYGLDCYAYCLLASGHLDLVVEAGLKDVDIAPLIPIIEAAGGVITTWNGSRAEQGGTCVAAATRQLHEETMKVLYEAMLGSA
jgi:fructose-1,6-bisphosphatase/inositol monophosphatase family enzyme